MFNLADRGHTAPGQRADLRLVSGDPLADITATRAIERIWRAGVPCDRRAFVANAAEAEETRIGSSRPEGSRSHRLAIGGEVGSFTDPDGFQ